MYVSLLFFLCCSFCTEFLRFFFFQAEDGIRDIGVTGVQTCALPILHIRNAPTRLMQDLGYGRGYQYAHDFDEQTAPMDCLPEALSGRRFYEPKDAGLEAEIRKRLEKMRAARSLSVSDPHQD